MDELMELDAQDFLSKKAAKLVFQELKCVLIFLTQAFPKLWPPVHPRFEAGWALVLSQPSLNEIVAHVTRARNPPIIFT